MRRARTSLCAAATVLAAALLTTCNDSHGPPPPATPQAGVNALPGMVLIGAGDIARCDATKDEATALLLDAYPAATVFSAGDNIRGNASLTDFTSCYGPSWGRHKARTRPAAGDNDYKTSGAAGYFSYFGAAAGDPTKGYYGYDLGAWHIMVLNSSIAMSAGSAQEQWLRAELAANTKRCTLAYWHYPRFSSTGTSVRAAVKPLWSALYEYGADVVVNAHYNVYERFAPQTPDGAADAINGLRQFTVGTGGQGADKLGTPRANSEVRSSGTYGVLKLTLDTASYAWAFVPIGGQAFTDAGATACHTRIAVSAVEVSPAAASVPVGGTVPLTATPKDAAGNPLTGRAVTWQSGAPAVAEVSASGLVTGKTAGGPVTITATSEGKSGGSSVSVTPVPVATVVVTPVSASVQVGATVQLAATPHDATGQPLTGRPVTWGTSASAIATVDGTGLVWGVGAGSATITATSEGKSGASAITVTAGSPSSAVLVGAGDITGTPTEGEPTAKLLDGIVATTPTATVFTAGDNAYQNGSASDYASYYDPTWGRHKARTRPAPGNHEYNTAGAAGYFGYFGSAAGDAAKGYYSYDLGDWHVVVINSATDMSAGSPQEQWLRGDLAASSKQCTVAYWHHPRFSSGMHGSWTAPQPIWEALYEAGAEIVVVGHDHDYERFAPQLSDGTADATYGLREFVVGTGGASHSGYGLGVPAANSEAWNASTFGVLKLTLSAGSYTWEFIPVAGQTFTDAGSGFCHDIPPNRPPTARPGGPYDAEGTVTLDGSASSDLENNVPLSFAWDFGDGARGSGATPTHTYVANGTYIVKLTVTDSKGATSAPATTTVTVANLPPVVNAGSDWSITPGSAFSLRASFSDPGTDTPWTYTITWGDGSQAGGTTTSQTDLITASHTYGAVGQYTVRVTVTDANGGTGWDEAVVSVVQVVTAETLVGAGQVARCDYTSDEATALLLDNIAGTVFTTGDNVRASGSLSDYTTCYGPSWGRHTPRTRPAVGDLDYQTAGAAGYFDYFGPAAGDRDKGYYSYELGVWHVVVLNSNIDMTVGSPQEQWLRADLAASSKRCTLAYWHHPRFSSYSTSVRSSVKPLWDDLYAARAEVVLNGHYRLYERFAPQTPDELADPQSGIRQFTVGTGGHGVDSFGTPRPNSEVRISGTYGVLKLTLATDAYSWEFVPVAGQTATDSGSGTCH